MFRDTDFVLLDGRLVDHLLPRLSLGAFAVLVVIHRQTAAYQDDFRFGDSVSFETLERVTAIEAAVLQGLLDELTTSGVVALTRENAYQLNPEFKLQIEGEDKHE